MNTGLTQIRFILFLFAAALVLLAPRAAMAQGNNMNIYNNILKENNHPGQKNWKREEATLDVDAIVRRENEERRRRQQAAQPRPRQQARCIEGSKVSDTGCGIYGIHPCFCVNGTPTWK